MKMNFRKILTGVVLSAIVLVVGGFCGETMVQTSSQKMTEMVEVTDAHCGSIEWSAVKNRAPVSNNVMPCCMEKHDNSAVFTPVASNERIKFQQVPIVRQAVFVAQLISQKAYASSPSPPEPGILSSNIRLE